MIASVADNKSQFSGLRPFNPLRDIRPVVELIELSFAQDLDPSSRQMLNEMRTMAFLIGPLFWLLNRTIPPLSDLFGGFVWLQEGQIVGNITVHQRYKGRPGWFISNLAVDPDYCRQGIARRLVMEGLELASKKGARRVSLEVRANNVAAQNMYAKLGFSKVDSMSKMRLRGSSNVAAENRGEYGIIAVAPNEWRECYLLARDVFPPEAREIAPVRQKDYRPSLTQRLLRPIGNLVRGQKVYRWAARSDDEFVALLTLRTGGVFASHSLSLMVDPDHRGEVEELLLDKALSVPETRYPMKPLLATIRPSYEAVVEIFRRYGFVEEQTLDTLTFALK